MSAVALNPIDLFSQYMQVTGVPDLRDSPCEDPALWGKRLGLVNGSSWISLWCTWFGRAILPGVKLINAGNEAVQLSFMRAHRRREPCPPQANIDLFVRCAEDLVTLYGADAILITCSTMNRSAGAVRAAMAPHRVPVVQIDEAMMEAAAARGGRVLVVATHGPTVASTRALLNETASGMGRTVICTEATVEEAFECLGRGDISGHNEAIARAIREAVARDKPDTVVLAQLSMSILKLSYPDCESALGVPVLTSGETGFERVRQLFSSRDERRPARH